MKKAGFILIMIFNLFVFTNCVDSSKELEQLKKDENTFNSLKIDKDEVESPDDRKTDN
ncbi:hypothetical protein [Tenacibaculum amylolyticum]|uniref:hypothetical protein n=1 Tax=Tenacibaculum amylolyticum TaxID=104269 RepID=UPI003894E20F